ncbi:uncharacterized protein LOC115625502 [Scaptodrosophila lebanonensis]|uniref:Uncharacterized protein LOC115625502 n=1 Tax=Drosophila lebanonensis TaxID=7225 RepID=A0A6J2TMP7_DROLE|nr:uncharacterized protein LOC115625502 [Scaptodrosophila lebanonensis]
MESRSRTTIIAVNQPEEDLSHERFRPIYPQLLPIRDVRLQVDENGFTTPERAALRNTWRFVEPFQRRFGKQSFYAFMTAREMVIETFRFDRTIDVSRLHCHAIWMMRTLNKLVNVIESVTEFRTALEECIPAHLKCGVDSNYMRMLTDVIKDYLVECPELCNNVSPTLNRALDHLFELISNSMHAGHMRKKTLSSMYLAVQQSETQVSDSNRPSATQKAASINPEATSL